MVEERFKESLVRYTESEILMTHHEVQTAVKEVGELMTVWSHPHMNPDSRGNLLPRCLCTLLLLLLVSLTDSSSFRRSVFLSVFMSAGLVFSFFLCLAQFSFLPCDVVVWRTWREAQFGRHASWMPLRRPPGGAYRSQGRFRHPGHVLSFCLNSETQRSSWSPHACGVIVTSQKNTL